MKCFHSPSNRGECHSRANRAVLQPRLSKLTPDPHTLASLPQECGLAGSQCSGPGLSCQRNTGTQPKASLANVGNAICPEGHSVLDRGLDSLGLQVPGSESWALREGLRPGIPGGSHPSSFSTHAEELHV